MSTWFRNRFVAAVAVAALGAGYLLLPGTTESNAVEQQSGSAASMIRVEVIRPERKPIREVIEQPAQIKPYEETPIYAKVAGYVRGVDVDMGDRVQGPRFDAEGKEVKPGQSLLRLFIPEWEDDVRRKAAAVAQAEAKVQQARASILVAEADVVTAESLAVQADASVKRAIADYAKRQSEFKRVVELAARGAVTEKLVDETRDQTAAADASREEAQAKRKSAEAAIAESRARLARSQADLVAAQVGVEVARADHAQAATMVQYGTVRAPFDGVVTRRNVHTGHMLQAGSQGEPLLILMRTDLLRVQVDVPEGSADRIKSGAAVQVRVPALGGEAATGTITRTAGALDVSTRTLRVESQITNSENRLRPGLYAYATIIVAQRTEAIVLPATAIVTESGQAFCSCVEGNAIVRKPITVGLRAKSDVEIAAGLQGDETVVRVNSTGLAAGQPVEAVPYVAPN